MVLGTREGSRGSMKGETRKSSPIAGSDSWSPPCPEDPLTDSRARDKHLEGKMRLRVRHLSGPTPDGHLGPGMRETAQSRPSATRAGKGLSTERGRTCETITGISSLLSRSTEPLSHPHHTLPYRLALLHLARPLPGHRLCSSCHQERPSQLLSLTLSLSPSD